MTQEFSIHGYAIVKIRRLVRKIYNAQVFFDGANAGNSAVCFILRSEPERKIIDRYCEGRVNACCFLWKSNNVIQVRCFNDGKKIDFCGHGLLASAYAWNQFATTSDGGFESLQTEKQTYTVCEKNAALWLRVPRIRCRPVTLPEDIDSYFDEKPERAAYAGDDDGYKIFAFGHGTDIAKLPVNFERISMDRRATIVTQASVSPIFAEAAKIGGGTKWDYSLRYFAPQYGVDEDIATGSANVVLADYWAQQGLSPPFHAHQCSALGGAVDSDIESGGEAVLLGGNVSVAPVGEEDDAATTV